MLKVQYETPYINHYTIQDQRSSEDPEGESEFVMNMAPSRKFVGPHVDPETRVQRAATRLCTSIHKDPECLIENVRIRHHADLYGDNEPNMERPPIASQWPPRGP